MDALGSRINNSTLTNPIDYQISRLVILQKLIQQKLYIIEILVNIELLDYKYNNRVFYFNKI
tara:strand:- start:387 stop:572 length:186 start_codon:yes stop_codon:yes gene_type:complete